MLMFVFTKLWMISNFKQKPVQNHKWGNIRVISVLWKVLSGIWSIKKACRELTRGAECCIIKRYVSPLGSVWDLFKFVGSESLEMIQENLCMTAGEIIHYLRCAYSLSPFFSVSPAAYFTFSIFFMLVFSLVLIWVTKWVWPNLHYLLSTHYYTCIFKFKFYLLFFLLMF